MKCTNPRTIVFVEMWFFKVLSPWWPGLKGVRFEGRGWRDGGGGGGGGEGGSAPSQANDLKNSSPVATTPGDFESVLRDVVFKVFPPWWLIFEVSVLRGGREVQLPAESSQ